jgi:hypothetical protein
MDTVLFMALTLVVIAILIATAFSYVQSRVLLCLKQVRRDEEWWVYYQRIGQVIGLDKESIFYDQMIALLDKSAALKARVMKLTPISVYFFIGGIKRDADDLKEQADRLYTEVCTHYNKTAT